MLNNVTPINFTNKIKLKKNKKTIEKQEITQGTKSEIAKFNVYALQHIIIHINTYILKEKNLLLLKTRLEKKLGIKIRKLETIKIKRKQ